jgi:hypothetical protein
MRRALYITAFLIALSAVVFRQGWGSDVIFVGSDANAGLLSAYKAQLPEAFTGSYISHPILGNDLQRPLSARALLSWMLPLNLFADTIYPFWLILSSLTLIAYLRLFGIGWLPATLGALGGFWVGSITLAAAGHLNKPAVTAFFVLALYFFERALRTESHRPRTGWSLLLGAAVGFMLLEQQDVGLYAAVFLAPYLLFRLLQHTPRPPFVRWLHIGIPALTVALLLSAAPAVEAYRANVADVEAGSGQTAESKWNFITQWSFPPEEWPDLIAPGYTGWNTGNPAGPYWGRMGRSAEWEQTGQGFANFRLDSLYIGLIPIGLALLGVFAAIRSRQAVWLFWSIAAVIALWLAMGKFSPPYHLLYQVPLLNNVRAPVKFLHNFQIIIGLLAAFGLHDAYNTIRTAKDGNPLRIVPIIAASVGGLALLAALIGPNASAFSNWGEIAGTITTNIRRAWLHAALMAFILAGGLYGLHRFRAHATRIALLLIAAVAFDALYLTSQYFKSENLSQMRRSNPVFDQINAAGDHGRVFLFATDGMYNRWLATDFRYHGIDAVNIWQMPRMAAPNRAFLENVGRNWKRMIDLTSARHALAPVAVWQQLRQSPHADAFEPVLYYRFVPSGNDVLVQAIDQPTQQNDQVLLRVRSALPRLAYFTNWQTAPADQLFTQLANRRFTPLTEVLISDTADLPAPTTPAETNTPAQPLTDLVLDTHGASGRIRAEAPGIVLFTQYYTPGWQVFVNDTPADLLRVNGIAMGVAVPAGDHTIRFACPRTTSVISVQSAGLLLAALGLLLLLRRPR